MEPINSKTTSTETDVYGLNIEFDANAKSIRDLINFT